jgi:hypothetical protein
VGLVEVVDDGRDDRGPFGGIVTVVAWAGRSALMPFLRWKVKAEFARRFAYQPVAPLPAPLQR